ncbi:MAG: LOG family protein [Nitrospiria bacterium]
MDRETGQDHIIQWIQSLSKETAHVEVIEELLNTVLRLSENHVTEKDIRIIHTALKEIRYGFKFFSPYQDVRKVSVFGSARTQASEPIYKHSALFAKRIAEAGFMVITGAGEGIMRAGQEGAGRARSFGINILLPFEQSANQFIENDPKLMTFKYFFTRKLFFIKEADAIALFPGGFGTHDEAFEALTLLQTGKGDPMPVVFIDEPGGTYWRSWRAYIEKDFVERGLISRDDLHLFKVTDQIDVAVEEMTTFYRRYHSISFVEGKPVLRLKQAIERHLLDQLNRHFSDIVVKGEIVETGPIPGEEETPDGLQLSRLTFDFNKRSFGRLRQMIDYINRYDGEDEKALHG